MEIVVNGRNSEISERFREHVEDKLHRIDKFDSRQRIQRVEVEVTHEANPRVHEKAARVEMTLRSTGPAVRAEASSTDQHSALDAAIDKLEPRLRRSNDRRRISHGKHTPTPNTIPPKSRRISGGFSGGFPDSFWTEKCRKSLNFVRFLLCQQLAAARV